MIFITPPFCVVGGDDFDAVLQVLSLYQDLTPHCIATSLETACLLKYACNAFHATKIAFANEMAQVANSLNVNPTELMRIFCLDNTLNCSSAYLKPGFSFGGACLLKDLQTLISFGNDLGSELPLLSSVLPSNEMHFEKKLNEIIKGNHQNLVILGITFKKNSDDLKESPFLKLVNQFIKQGIPLRIYDPDLSDSSKKQLKSLLPLIDNDLDNILKGCDGVVICKDILQENNLLELKSLNIPIYNLHFK